MAKFSFDFIPNKRKNKIFASLLVQECPITSVKNSALFCYLNKK
jgi:hypothetical protein